MTQHQRLLIIDFGSQVTQLIARRLRELNIYCEIHPFQKVTDAFLTAFAPKAVILSGGPASVFSDGAPMPPASVFTLGVPILGICYGQQVMMHCLGGRVERGHGTAEFGRAFVTPAGGTLPLLEGWFDAASSGREQVWMSHGDQCVRNRAGLCRLRHLAQCAVCDHRRPGAAVLRRAVSPRGAPHAQGRKTL